MKRQIVITSFLILASFSQNVFASTQVPPTITSDSDWNQSGNPYLIKGKVVVPKGTTLSINAGAQVIFEGASTLEVEGTLEVQGSAAGPAVFNMVEGGLQSEIFLNGATAHISNAKIISGVFLARDAKLTLEGSDITKGSGIYLQGSTTARLKNNKIYGNATGVVLDGQVTANLSFNTLVQNTYGLLIKRYSDLSFTNNSVHDNQREVINNTPSLKLSGNYWGTQDSKSVQAKIQGSVELNPLKNLKDILRVYVRTQLPVITSKMSTALAAKERRQEKEDAIALKKLKKAQEMASQKPGSPAASSEVGAAEVSAPIVEAPAEKAAPEAPAEASVEMETASPASKVISVKSLPPAPHKLKPLANLPPEQNFGPPEAASSFNAIVETQSSSSPKPPELPASTATASDMSVPSVPDLNLTATSAPPPVPGDSNAVPPPPDLGEQMPPSIPGVPPVSASTDNTPAASQAPPPPMNVVPNADQQKAVQKMDGISGDIDGMQPPPLDLGPDLSNPSAGDLDAVKPPTYQGDGSKTNNNSTSVPSASDLSLPPLKDSDVIPPKDLDLPPIDDLGNINLDSRNK